MLRGRLQKVAGFRLLLENLHTVAKRHPPVAVGRAGLRRRALVLFQIRQPELGKGKPVCFQAFENELASNAQTCEISP